jgi:hypothetical protein
MEKLKNLKVVLAVLVVILVFVIIKTTAKNQFKEDANHTLEKVTSDNFTILLAELKNSQNEYLLVDISESGLAQFENSVKIPVEKIGEQSSLQILKNTNSKIVLVSDNVSQSEKAWVILSQLGIKNLFVLSTHENPEEFKYKFQPDTGAKLE